MKTKAFLVMPSSPLTVIDLDGADLGRLFLPTIIFFLFLVPNLLKEFHTIFSTIHTIYSIQHYIVHSVFHV